MDRLADDISLFFHFIRCILVLLYVYCAATGTHYTLSYQTIFLNLPGFGGQTFFSDLVAFAYMKKLVVYYY